MSEEQDDMIRRIPDRDNGTDHLDDGLLIAYRAGRASDEERAKVEQHLAGCAECRALLGALDRPVPEALASWAMDATPVRSKLRPMIAAFALAAAAALAVLFLVPHERALSEYTLTGPRGGVSNIRGAAPATLIFVPTSKIEWSAEPARSETDTTLLVFVEEGRGRVRRAPEDAVQRGPTGVLLYAIQAERLFGERYGMRTVHLLVVQTPPPKLPDALSIAELERALGPHRSMQSQVNYQSQVEGEDR